MERVGESKIERKESPLAVSRDLGLHWILRVAVAGCFVGHGAFGIINGGKAEWLVYFHVFGIPDWLAWRLMPLIGTFDISVAVLTLFHPLRAFLVWAVFWTTWTAFLRPLAGQGWSEFFERAGNYGVPLALLYLSGLPRTVHAFVGQALPRPLDQRRAERLAWILRVTTALLLIGHGGYGAFVHKPAWIGYLGALGIDASTVRSLSLVSLVGWFEIALGLAVLALPVAPLLLFVFAWKVGTESLRLVVGEPVFEFVERGGSYGAPLALFYLSRWSARYAPHPLHVTNDGGAPNGAAVAASGNAAFTAASKAQPHVPAIIATSTSRGPSAVNVAP